MRRCLERPDAKSRSRSDGGVVHRHRTSLGAHCLVMIARKVGRDGLHTMVAAGERPDGPRLARASYPVLIARAAVGGRSLDLVLYPGGDAVVSTIEIAGLLLGRHYLTLLAQPKFLQADATGAATTDVPLRGRTHLSIELFAEEVIWSVAR